MPTIIAVSTSEELKKLFSAKDLVQVPKAGDTIKGTIVAISPREILIDIAGYKTGIVRGYELQDKETAAHFKAGDPVEATGDVLPCIPELFGHGLDRDFFIRAEAPSHRLDERTQQAIHSVYSYACHRRRT